MKQNNNPNQNHVLSIYDISKLLTCNRHGSSIFQTNSKTHTAIFCFAVLLPAHSCWNNSVHIICSSAEHQRLVAEATTKKLKNVKKNTLVFDYYYYYFFIYFFSYFF